MVDSLILNCLIPLDEVLEELLILLNNLLESHIGNVYREYLQESEDLVTHILILESLVLLVKCFSIGDKEISVSHEPEF